MNLRPADLIFTMREGNILSELVSLISSFTTKKTAEISHIAIYLGNGLIAESTMYGVVINDVRIYVNSRNHMIKYGRVIPPFEKQDLITNCKKAAGKVPYAYLQLFVAGFKRIFRFLKIGDVQKDAMTCSEFVANMFNDVGIKLVPGVKLANVSPLDIYNSKHVVHFNIV